MSDPSGPARLQGMDLIRHQFIACDRPLLETARLLQRSRQRVLVVRRGGILWRDFPYMEAYGKRLRGMRGLSGYLVLTLTQIKSLDAPQKNLRDFGQARFRALLDRELTR